VNHNHHEKINIEFTKEQFEALAKLVYTGEWIVNAHRLPDEHIEEFEDVENHLYSSANLYGLEHLAMFDADLGKTFPSKEIEEEMLRYVDEYEEQSFWDELCQRLAERDAIKMHGEEKFCAMDFMERLTLLGELEEYYSDKFCRNGLDYLNLADELSFTRTPGS
jgi:hypothetical protein